MHLISICLAFLLSIFGVDAQITQQCTQNVSSSLTFLANGLSQINLVTPPCHAVVFLGDRQFGNSTTATAPYVTASGKLWTLQTGSSSLLTQNFNVYSTAIQIADSYAASSRASCVVLINNATLGATLSGMNIAPVSTVLQTLISSGTISVVDAVVLAV